jgi:hypothetical protein
MLRCRYAEMVRVLGVAVKLKVGAADFDAQCAHGRHFRQLLPPPALATCLNPLDPRPGAIVIVANLVDALKKRAAGAEPSAAPAVMHIRCRGCASDLANLSAAICPE